MNAQQTYYTEQDQEIAINFDYEEGEIFINEMKIDGKECLIESSIENLLGTTNLRQFILDNGLFIEA